MIAKMQQVNIGIIGLGNVGLGTLEVLAENAGQIALKLGFGLRVAAVCSRSVNQKKIPETLGEVFKSSDWREIVAHPEVDVVAELVGGTSVAAEIIDGAIAHKKSVVTANKELMASCGSEIWDRAIRAGIGYDSHRFAEGERLVIGGVEIEHERGLTGHSDADVLTHAVIDALLGACGLGDLGELFPPEEEQWQGADSIDMLRVVLGKLPGAVANVDVTVICEHSPAAAW